MQELLAIPGAAVALAALLGLLVGSFLNVVILRLPARLMHQWREQSRELLELDAAAEPAPPGLVRQASHCPQCKHALGALENIPLVSWLALRGRCRHCGAKISAQYPLVELLTAICSALVVWKFGATWPAAAGLLFTWALIALAGIDVRTQLLPDQITLPLLWLGLLVALVPFFVDAPAAIVGAAIGYVSLWSVYWAFKLLTGKEGMGYGDFKLLAAIGAWLGWQMLPLTILLSSVVGAVVGISLIVFARHGRNVPIPFGPYLAAAGVIALFWGREITSRYLGAS